jgi:multidrug efflux system membrane fusion protein
MPDEQRRRPGRTLAWAAVVVVVAGAAWFLLEKRRPAAAPARGAGARVVPIVAATARRTDVPVYLDGLGTVTALNTVTVRSRVDGQLVSVNYREGQLVSPGALLAEIDPRPFRVQLLQAQAQRAKDEATLANARLDLQRYEALLAQDSIPRQQLDTQRTLVDQLDATVKSDEAQVESAQLNLTYCRIAAPIAGRVGLRLVDSGNMVRAADPAGLVVIAQVSPIAVVFTIPADRLAPVTAQMRQGRRLAVEAWDRDLRVRLANGTLEAVDNQIDTTTGTVRLKAVFSNEDGALFANQFVNARLLVDTLHDAVVVPTAALQHGAQGTFVWAVKPDATVEMREVEVRLSEGDRSAIGRGLPAGATVVVEGVDNLQPGTKVASGPPPGNRPAGGRAPAAKATP